MRHSRSRKQLQKETARLKNKYTSRQLHAIVHGTPQCKQRARNKVDDKNFSCLSKAQLQFKKRRRRRRKKSRNGKQWSLKGMVNQTWQQRDIEERERREKMRPQRVRGPEDQGQLTWLFKGQPWERIESRYSLINVTRAGQTTKLKMEPETGVEEKERKSRIQTHKAANKDHV